MAYLKSIGSVLEQYVAGSFVAVAQVESFGLSGSGNESYEVRPLDSSDGGVLHLPNGWIEGGSATFGLYYDPALAGHQSITDAQTTPALTNWRFKHSNVAATAVTFTSGEIRFDEEVPGTSGVKATVTLKISGLVGWPT